MAFEQQTMKVSRPAYQAWTEVKRAMEADAGREVTYSEVIERLAELWRAKAAQR